MWLAQSGGHPAECVVTCPGGETLRVASAGCGGGYLDEYRCVHAVGEDRGGAWRQGDQERRLVVGEVHGGADDVAIVTGR